jgi:hypothetical protein
MCPFQPSELPFFIPLFVSLLPSSSNARKQPFLGWCFLTPQPPLLTMIKEFPTMLDPSICFYSCTFSLQNVRKNNASVSISIEKEHHKYLIFFHAHKIHTVINSNVT